MAARFASTSTSHRQSPITYATQPQLSSELEQQVEHMETPELINAPGIADFRQLQGSQSIQTHPPAPDDIRTPAVYSSLADRIKSGRTRRNVHQSSPSAPSAAVYSVAEAVDAAIAPAAGPSEWHVDRQDADYTAPEGISGASNEHIHHGCSQAAPANQPPVSSTGFAQYADAAQTQVATPAKVESKRARKGSNSALLPTATELALGPDSSENALQEDTKVKRRQPSKKQLQPEDASNMALTLAALESRHPGTSVTKKARQRKPKPAATDSRSNAAELDGVLEPVSLDANFQQKGSPDEPQPAPVIVQTKSSGRKRAASKARAGDAVIPAVAAVALEAGAMTQAKRQRVKASETAVSTETELAELAEQGKLRPRQTEEGVEAAEPSLIVEGAENGSEVTATKRKRRAKVENTQPILEMPNSDTLDAALQWQPAPRPVPNLGYACICMELRERKPPVFMNRDMVQKTFKAKGLPYVSQLALENVKALKALVQWNHEHGIRFFRMTSNMLPWCTEYSMEDLPDFPAIAEELAFAGKLARAYQQRLTFHPSHFVKLGGLLGDKAGKGQRLLQRSCRELEVHSKILDLMGYEPSHWNKVNIHIGGVYGDKETTLERWAQGFQHLSDNCKKRLTLENDDWVVGFSVKDLLPLSQLCNIPIVFDFHHHKFCSGGWTEKEAFYAALETWPKGVRPVVHWSESQDDRRASAHSDYIQGPMNLHGKEADVDVMIEAKRMERTLLQFRDGTVSKQEPSIELAMTASEPMS